ncbi:DoxX family protein [Chitinophaga sp. 22321]|uniref:DoxX family protein n=1 Tax=Chitinophaga hostae TaxID=2831022 RepID=A0ABS5J1D6_9BACT|nr:DoxX family protein [Chitinophaga hostae]MBS0029041.1 DoxX family protein [Chitinophaga hostae]
MTQLLATDNSWTGLVLRLTVGIVLFPHATQKMFGWFNGPGLSGEMKFMTGPAGLPVFIAILAIIIECAGMAMLLAGVGTRVAAMGIFVLFTGMISFHWKNGFFMNWFGKLPAGQEGFEYHLLVLGICIVLFIVGGGRYSVDQWLTD